jgi:hypothetical protein
MSSLRTRLGIDCGLPERLNPSGPVWGSALSIGAPEYNLDTAPPEEWMEFSTEEGDPVTYSGGANVYGAAVSVDFNPLRFGVGGVGSPPLLRANPPLQVYVTEERAGEFSVTLSFTLWRTTWGVPTSYTEVDLTAAGKAGSNGADVSSIVTQWSDQLNNMGVITRPFTNGTLVIDGEFLRDNLGTGLPVEYGFITDVSMAMTYGFSRDGAINPLATITPAVTPAP